MTWLQAFLVTEAVEIPVVVVLWTALLRWRPRRSTVTRAASSTSSMTGSAPASVPSLAYRVSAGAVPSALTHPLLWHLALYLLRDLALCGRPSTLPCYTAVVLVLEAIVVGVEAVVLRALGAPKPLATSLLANTASVAMGLLIQR